MIPSRRRRRWIGWKTRLLLRIRYGSEDDGAKKSPKAGGNLHQIGNGLRTTRSMYKQIFCSGRRVACKLLDRAAGTAASTVASLALLARV